MVVGSVEAEDLDEENLVELVMGRPGGPVGQSRQTSARSEVVVKLEEAGLGGHARVSVDGCAGEVIGLTGLPDSGYDLLPYVLSGHERTRTGSLVIRGVHRELSATSARELMQAGVVSVPADRRKLGLTLSLRIDENVTLPDIGKFRGWGGRVSRRKEGLVTRELMRDFFVRASGVSALVGSLSGGNQQKVLLAKWFRLARVLVVLYEPTQGVDVGARAEIYGLIARHARESGLVVFVVSSDYEELATICDRVYVFRGGRVAAELGGDSIDEDMIAQAAWGSSSSAERMVLGAADG